MALIPSSRYPAQVDTGDGAYPQGKARSSGSYNDGTGTPLNKDWINDLWGFLQSLLQEASITPSGDPDEVGASQYLEAVQAVSGQVASPLVQAASKVTIERTLLRLHRLDVTVDDTAESLGAISTGILGDPSKPTLVVKVDSTGVVLAYDDGVVDQGGVIPSVTSLVADAASDGSRIVAMGVGGQRGAYTDNDGGSWTAVANGVAGAVQFIVRDGIGGNFICGGSGTGSVYRSPNASTTWTSTPSEFSQPFGLAALTNGTLVILGNSGAQPRFSVSNDAGASFSVAGTTPPPNATDADEPGDLRGCQFELVHGFGTKAYHIMRCDSGARIRTNTSTTGLTWTAGAILTAPIGAAFASRPRLLIDQDQALGLFVIVAPLDNGTTALYASRDFVTWTGPAAVKSLATAAWALAGGRLFCTRDGSIYASDSARY